MSVPPPRALKPEARVASIRHTEAHLPTVECLLTTTGSPSAALRSRPGHPEAMNSLAPALATGSLDHRWPWVRDFALVGGLTGFFAPFSVLREAAYASLTGLGGTLGGALLGLFSAWFMAGAGRRWRKVAFVPAGLLLGALWGMSSVLPTVAFAPLRDLMVLSLAFAGFAGALQLGWFWLAYCHLRVHRKSTWGVVVLASVLGGGLGWAGVAAMGLLH